MLQPILEPKIHDKPFLGMYTQYYSSVQRICLRFTKNRDDAEDLAQEIFIKVMASNGEFAGDSKAFTWIYRISVNCCLDFLRWKKRQDNLLSGYTEKTDLSGSRGSSIGPHARFLLARMLDGLDAVDRQVVSLRFEKGLTHDEIARICGVSRVAITKRLARFQTHSASLRTALQDELDSHRKSPANFDEPVLVDY